MSSPVATSPDITQYQIHLFKELNTLAEEIKNKVSSDLVLKTYQLTLTLFAYHVEEKKWTHYTIESERVEETNFPLELPPDDKKIVTLLRNFAQAEKNANLSLPSIILSEYDKAQTSGKRAKVLKSYRELNSRYLKEDPLPKFSSEVKEAAFRTFNVFSMERFATEIRFKMTVLSKKDPTKKTELSLSQDLKQECSTCKGWRTTASVLNECSGCLQNLPENTSPYLISMEERAAAERADKALALASLKAMLSK